MALVLEGCVCVSVYTRVHVYVYERDGDRDRQTDRHRDTETGERTERWKYQIELSDSIHWSHCERERETEGERERKTRGEEGERERDLRESSDIIHWSHCVCWSTERCADRIWNCIDYEHLWLIKWNWNTFSLSYWKRLNTKKLIFSEIKFINTMIIHLAFIMILLLNHQNIASCAWWEPAGSTWRASLAANVKGEGMVFSLLFISEVHHIPAQKPKSSCRTAWALNSTLNTE